MRGGGAKCATCLTATTDGRCVQAQSSSTARPLVATADRGEAIDVWANYVTHHTRALSYVAHKISQIVSRFVHIVLDGDGCVWSRWSTPTRVGVNISVHRLRGELQIVFTKLQRNSVFH